jgi:hypothetical protein
LADHVGNILHTADRIFPDYVSIESNFRDSFYRWLFYFSPYIRVFEFIAGCFAAQLFLQLSDRKITRAEWRLGQIVFWLSLCGLIAYGYFQRMGWPAAVARYGHFASENFGCAPEIAALIFCVSRYDTVFSRWLGGWLLVTLDETSYSIYIVGWSCVDSKYLNTVKKGNATSSVRETCNFTNQCEYLVDVARLNDVAPDCGKDFTVTYKCTTEAAPVTAALPGEANGNSVLLKCD